MTTDTTKKPMLRALAGQVSARPPFWFMRQAGRYLPEYRELRKRVPDFLSLCYNPDLALEVSLQPLRRFRMDAAILFSDILVVPDALGQDVRFVEGEGPMLAPVRSAADIERLEIGNIETHLAPVFETVRRLRGGLPAEAALIGFAGAPWTVGVYMVEGRGGTDCGVIRAWAEEKPDTFQPLIDLLVEATGTYLVEQVRAGAEIIQVFDSWAGVLDGDGFRRWVIEPTRQIVDRLRRDCPGVPVIGFPRNAGAAVEDYVAGTGVDGVSLDSGTPLEWIAEALQPRCAVQGNLDNAVLKAGGPEMERATLHILEALSPGPFIFNLGHGILPDTPPEHVARVAELVRSWPASAAGGGG